MSSASQYKKNYLTDVIFKINFPAILGLESSPPDLFQDRIKADFPTKEMKEQVGVRIESTGSGITTHDTKMAVWNFKTDDSKMLVELTPESLAVVSKTYTTYTAFKEVVSKVTTAFFEVYPTATIDRLGLRYINQIHIEEPNFFDWGEYINGFLINHLGFVGDRRKIRRVFQTFEIACDEDAMLRFISGIFNSVYPSEVIRKEYILDYDCYTKIQFDKEALSGKLDEFNEIITRYFEMSVTDSFRKILND